MTCVLCNEPIVTHLEVVALNPVESAHAECSLRMALGGIGHLIAHEHWCLTMHDPDAGLTYRQSALLTAAFVETVGVDAAVSRGMGT